ncbi:uncharacterized protein LOC125457839 [Stegostoma tigrinum]|uniref:uncharacterized protein LOC125457839 n=1 Tax=Stegostoma tigrinum TaxID=3053191 RepID=UPI0028701734|nr:uncharacterized protein LOC125457839 [Stegostoma tigrinum]XP_048398464.2 uncharacterized protein LOC125457839 [Stegostoma tigrinum]XP_059507020.1 uncharacterized protein LOC125457839 [Stegostoma tigrinum]XP_059507021.1 uncharacterized protein LOC125457839 [Stegostoma tigrinum]XP_059507022.1 uncharacterized protein LOC125457839 [Stegostoma tigrinum]
MAVQKTDERKKCHNFSDEDLDTLLNEVEAKRHRLLGYEKRRAPRKVSILAWKEVAETVTANSTIPRTAEQCRKKLNDLTRSARIKMAHNARERLLTRDGGVAFLKDLNEYEERARQLVGICSSVSGSQGDIGMGRGAQPSLDVSAGDSGPATAANVVERRPGEGTEPLVKVEEPVNVIELKEEVEWPPEDQEVAHTGWEGKQSDTVTPVPTLHLQDADVSGLQSWDNIQITPSLSPGPSCSERGTAGCPSSSYDADAVGSGGGYVIERSEMSSGEGPAAPASDPLSSVIRGPHQPSDTSVEEVEELFVTGLRDILVAQHDRQLDSLDLIRQEMTGLCQELRELKTGLCQEVRDLKMSLCQEVRELKTSLCQQLSLSIQKLTEALTATKEIQHQQDAASDLNQITTQKLEVRADGTEVTHMNPVEPFLTALHTETVQPQELDAISGQQHSGNGLSVSGRVLGTRGARSRVRGRRRRR